MRLHLKSVYNVYGTLGFIHKWCPLVILVVFVLGWAGVPGKSFFSKLSQVGHNLYYVASITNLVYHQYSCSEAKLVYCQSFQTLYISVFL